MAWRWDSLRRWLLAATGAGALGLGVTVWLGSPAGSSAQQRDLRGYQAFSAKHVPTSELADRLRECLAGLQQTDVDVVPDPAGNRVFVGGQGADARLVAQLLQTLDRAPVEPARARPESKPSAAPPAAVTEPAVIRGYSVGDADLGRLVENLRRNYAGTPGISFAGDARSRQVIVNAPPSLQRQIAAQLATLSGPSAVAVPQAPLPAQVGVATPGAVRPTELRRMPVPADEDLRIGSVERRLTQVTALQFEESLRQLTGPNVTITPSADRTQLTVSLATRAAGPATMIIDRRLDMVTLRGSERARLALDRLVGLLDRRAESPDTATEVVPVSGANPDRVNEAIAATYTALRDQAAAMNAGLRSRPNGQLVAAQAAPPEVGQPPAPSVRPDAKLDEKPEESPDGKPAAPPGAEPTAEETDENRGLVGTVQLEILEGLDVILIKGSKRDVDTMKRLLKKIEDVSASTKPEVLVYPLEHTNSEALVPLLQQAYQQALSSRQGSTVNITALVKPNAVLLIGQPETVQAAVDLIRKLDHPVSPTSTMKVFRLKHIAASDAATTVQNFFSQRAGGGATGGAAGPLLPGAGNPLTTGPAGGQGNANAAAGSNLAPRVIVISDFHSNSLIVNASARDMMEVDTLVQQLDVENNAATTELRIFRLANTLAADLAPILQAALRGQAATGQPGQQGQPGGGAAAGGAGTARATSLQFMSLEGGANDAVKKLVASGIVTDVVVSADASTNALLVRGPTRSMDLIAAVIRELDQLPKAESQIKVFTVVNGDAMNLTATLQQLFGQQVTANRGTGGLFGAANLQIPPQTGGLGAGESSLVPLRFTYDARTNSIIASGSAGDLRVVETVLLRLDEGDIQTRKMMVYRLKNAFAQDVANSITTFLTSQRTIIQQSLLFNQAVGPSEQLEREVIVVAEPQSNSVIVSATPQFYDEIIEIIEQLDFRPSMVMVQVLIAEVQLDDQFEFGVEFGLQDSLLFDRGRAAGGTAAGVPGFNFNSLNPLPNVTAAGRDAVAGQALSNFGVGRAGSAGFGGLVLSAASDSVSILIRALQESGRLQVLSRPQVMAVHNRPAQVQVGQIVPRIRGSTLSNVGSQQNIQDVETGLILNIIPQINDDGVVLMYVQAIRSALGDVVQTITNADGTTTNLTAINNTSATTTIRARDGQTVVFAGLIQDAKQATVRRVPYLSDIPALGSLFQYTSTDQTRRELMIVMTPRIVKEDEQYEWLKSVESERMNWCLKDVVNLHGDVGLRGNNCLMCGDRIPVVYPDSDPTGREVYMEPLEPLPNHQRLNGPPSGTELPEPDPAPGTSLLRPESRRRVTGMQTYPGGQPAPMVTPTAASNYGAEYSLPAMRNTPAPQAMNGLPPMPATPASAAASPHVGPPPVIPADSPALRGDGSFDPRNYSVAPAAYGPAPQ